LGGQTEKLHNAGWQERQTKQLGWQHKWSMYTGKGGGHAGSQAARHTRRGTRLAGKQTKKSGSRGKQERGGRKDRVGHSTRAGGWASQTDSRLSGKAAGRQTN
jgi:hypothetical protein